MTLKKEHGRVTGIVWKTAEEQAAYQALKEYAEKRQISTSAAAKQLVMQGLRKSVN